MQEDLGELPDYGVSVVKSSNEFVVSCYAPTVFPFQVAQEQVERITIWHLSDLGV